MPRPTESSRTAPDVTFPGTKAATRAILSPGFRRLRVLRRLAAGSSFGAVCTSRRPNTRGPFARRRGAVAMAPLTCRGFKVPLFPSTNSASRSEGRPSPPSQPRRPPLCSHFTDSNVYSVPRHFDCTGDWGLQIAEFVARHSGWRRERRE